MTAPEETTTMASPPAPATDLGKPSVTGRVCPLRICITLVRLPA